MPPVQIALEIARMSASLPHIRTTDALPEEDPRVTLLRQLVCAVGNKVLEEQAARQRLALEVQQLRAELGQQRAAIRTASRR
jgi:hypothetical protein